MGREAIAIRSWARSLPPFNVYCRKMQLCHQELDYQSARFLSTCATWRGSKGGYSTVKDYIGPLHSQEGCVWKFIYDVLISLKEKQAIEFLLLLSCADPPVISPARA